MHTKLFHKMPSFNKQNYAYFDTLSPKIAKYSDFWIMPGSGFYSILNIPK